jgi:hypothetical protein
MDTPTVKSSLLREQRPLRSTPSTIIKIIALIFSYYIPCGANLHPAWLNASIWRQLIFRSHHPCRASAQWASRFIRSDLCAQLAPLNRYGVAGVSSALIDGLVALVIASRNVLRSLAATPAPGATAAETCLKFRSKQNPFD